MNIKFNKLRYLLLITYNFEIYYYKDKKNPANLLSYKSDYIVNKEI